MAAAEYYNISQMDETPFGTEESNVNANFVTFIKVIMFIRLSLYLVVVSNDIFFICVICRNRKLQTRLNIYILHWCILHGCLFLKDPILFIFYLIFNEEIIHYCVELHSHTSVLCLYFTIAFIIAGDWYISACNPQLLNTYKKHYKLLIYGLYIMCGIMWCTTSVICTERISQQRYSNYFVSYEDQVKTRTVLYGFGLIAITILNVLARRLSLTRDSLKTAYALTVSNIIFYSYVPMLVDYIISLILTSHKTLEYFLAYIEFIPEFIGTANNICVIYILGSRNKHFKMAYDSCFKKSVQEYDNENLDDSEEGSDVDDKENDTSNEPNEAVGPEAILVL